MNSINPLSRAVTVRENFRTSSRSVGGRLSAGYGSRLGATGASVQPVMPNVGSNISVRTPNGVPNVGVGLPKGLSVDPYITIVLDATAITPTVVGKTDIKLFDKAAYYQSVFPATPANPSNSVYIGTPTKNLYNWFLEQLCAETMFFDGMLLQVSKVSTGVNTEATQLDETVTTVEGSITRALNGEIPLSNYTDLDQFNQFSRVIAFVGEQGRVSKDTTWLFPLYNGCKVRMTLWKYAQGANL